MNRTSQSAPLPSSSVLYIAGIEVIAETLGFLPSPFGFVPGAEGRFLAALAEEGVSAPQARGAQPRHARHCGFGERPVAN